MSNGANSTMIIGLLNLSKPLSQEDYDHLSTDNSTAMVFFHDAIFENSDHSITTYDHITIGFVGEDKICIHGELYDGADIWAFKDFLKYLTEKGYKPAGKIGFEESLGLVHVYQVSGIDYETAAHEIYGNKSLTELDPDMHTINAKIEELRERIATSVQEKEEQFDSHDVELPF